MSSSNNFSVNNSLTVSGNTILGSDATSTLIVNSLQTLNNGLDNQRQHRSKFRNIKHNK